MAEGKLTVGVDIDATDAFAGFADAVLKEVRPALEQIQREIESKLGDSGGGGGGGTWSRIGDIAGGSFIGAFASNIATKGLAMVQDAVSKIAGVIQGVLSSGWDRIVSIDTAKTKMEALGNSAKDVKTIMDNALQAVKGTAFGLQDAATVAATALAAGVKPGESLVKYLKLVADTAAITRKAGQDMGAEFNDVGAIINKITTQGYATNQELQMLSDRGLPIYQKLSEAMRIGTGDVIETAEKTGVAASQVREALENTVGGAALKMGESFEGGSANAQAALARLGEALLKPFFEPAKEGVFNFTAAIDDLTKVVVANGPEITRVVEAIAIAFVDVGTFVLQSSGDVLRGVGEIVGGIGDIYGSLLKYQAWVDENIRGKSAEDVAALRAESEAAFNWGESLKTAGEKMMGINPDPLKAKIHELGTTIANGQQVNLDYAKSQDELTAAINRGMGPMVYQAQMMEWINKVRAYAADPKNAPQPGPVPSYIDAGQAATPYMRGKAGIPNAPSAAGGVGGMPDDVAKSSGSGGKDKKSAEPWLAPGAPIPTMEELLAAGGEAGAAAADAASTDLPDAVTDLGQVASQSLPQAATDLSQAATDLSAAAQTSSMFGLPMMGGSNPNNVSTAGLQPQSLAALSVIQAQFPMLPLSSGFRASDPYEWHPGGRGLDLSVNANTPDGSALGDAANAWILANKELLGVQGTLWKVADHFDHIHVSIKEGLSPLLAMGGGGMNLGGLTSLFGGAMPNMPPIPYPGGGDVLTSAGGGGGSSLAFGQTYGAPIQIPGLGTVVPVNQPDWSQLGLPPGTYQIPGGVAPPDPAKIAAQEAKIRGLEQDLIIKEARIREMKADAAQSEKLAAVNALQDLKDNKAKAEADLEKLKRGEVGKPQTINVPKPSASQAFDYNSLPFGHPQRVIAGILGGLGVNPGDLTSILGAAAAPVQQLGSGVAGPIGGAAGSIAGSIFGVPLPGPMGYPGKPTAPSTDLNQLIKEGNPLALAQAAGINVPDYSRAGGGPQSLTVSGGPASDAMGRIYSDTAALVDRTFSNLDAAEKARHDQVMSVLNEVRDRLAKDYVEPVTSAAVTAGIDGIGSGVTTEIGNAIGNAAAPQIASALNTPSPGILQGGNYATGGPIFGPGTGVSDSILARVSHGEYVLPASDVARMGGFRGVDQFRAGLWGRLPRFATGGGVDVSSTVGAELFGVGQVPILSTIINLLVSVVLKLIGVQIEARDTLNELTTEFRDYRGDFKAFDAAGRIMNDTSGLLDRSGSSEQAAVDERVRILKLVLEGLLKWLIEKIIVPIGKAVANTAISIGAQAVNGAITGGMGAAFPGGSAVGSIVGGMASSAITAAGGAAVDIWAEIGTLLAESLLSVAIDSFGQLFQSAFPDLMSLMFSGVGSANIWDKLTMTGGGNMAGGIAGAFAGIAGGLATLFDDGGVANGVGLMPKATIRPERVLSPQQTQSFDRLVAALTSGRAAATTTIHAPFTVVGGERGGRDVRNRLLELMS